MGVRIDWEPAPVPEERKKLAWERIIRTTVGEPAETLWVRLRLARGSHRWRVETRPLGDRRPGLLSDTSTTYTPRIIDALRSAGVPVD